MTFGNRRSSFGHASRRPWQWSGRCLGLLAVVSGALQPEPSGASSFSWLFGRRLAAVGRQPLVNKSRSAPPLTPQATRRCSSYGIQAAFHWRVRTGASPWRGIPPEYGLWQTADDSSRRWQRNGVWTEVC
ncbi:transposase [Streptomyces sp. NPDC054871]